MEEKESTVSGSMSDSGSDSPSPVTSYAGAVAETNTPVPFNVSMTNMDAARAGLVTPFSGSMTSSGGTNTTSPGMTTPATAEGTAEAVLAIVAHGSNGGDLSGKKKRGRPRKYDSEGNLIIRSAPATAAAAASETKAAFAFSPASLTSTKKSRGRAFGSGNWNLLASIGSLFATTAGEDFTPHIITVNTGEDLAGKILSFTQKGPRGICVLSAIGAVSNVTIRQSGSSGGILTYEGRFEILTLTGSFVITEIGGVRNKTGGLSVSLAGPDGRVIGGVVAGVLTAASPIQVVIGSFLTFSPKPQKRKYERRSAITPALPSASSNAVTPSTGQVSQTKPENESAFGGHQQAQIADAPSFNPVWNTSETEPNPVISPDINVSAPSE